MLSRYISYNKNLTTNIIGYKLIIITTRLQIATNIIVVKFRMNESGKE